MKLSTTFASAHTAVAARDLMLFALLLVTPACSSTPDGATGDASVDGATNESAADATPPDTSLIDGTPPSDTGTCPSATPLRCGATCVDSSSDHGNCGSCGHACAASERCSAGSCKTSGCASAADCNDGFNCTIDTCLSTGACAHAIGPNSGATACSPGQYCVVDKGCIASTACAKDADCADGNACHVNPHCDPASSVCTWTTLDKDHDGHPPIVCGGDDCDDSDPNTYPDAP
ncbi:MAG: hypothetical protein ACHREM_19425, partial [Polyangiales bacterium]